jgi:hypothetical protein
VLIQRHENGVRCSRELVIREGWVVGGSRPAQNRGRKLVLVLLGKSLKRLKEVLDCGAHMGFVATRYFHSSFEIERAWML